MKLVNLIFFSFVFLTSFFHNFFIELLFVYCLLLIAFLIKKTYNSPFFFFFIFALIYLLPFYFNIFLEWQISGYDVFNSKNIIFGTLRCYSLFFFVIYLNFKIDLYNNRIIDKLKVKPNFAIHFFLLVLYLYLFLYSLNGETILDSGYGNQVKVATSGYEYAIVFYFLSYLYAKRNTFNTCLFLLLGCVFVYKDFMFGGRISSLQMIFLIYILFFDGKFKFKYYLFIGIIMFFLMKLFEIYRITNDLDATISLFNIVNEKKIYGSNEGDVVYSSMTIYAFITENIVTLEDRILSFFSFLLSIFTKGIELSPLANMSSYKQDMFPRGGGGLFPVYVFFWLGYSGVIISGLLLSKLFNNIVNLFTNKYLLIYGVMVLITFPRWFAYYPLNMFKISLLPIIVFFLLQINYKIKK